MWVLKDAEGWESLSRTARKTAEREYDISIIAKRYAELYQTILTQTSIRDCFKDRDEQ
jgi:hypothetical protein